ncbi:Serine/threonine-protein kinase PknH [Gemmata obscuriglobus]|uniref:Serine/threonine protein kinase n=1 Tax=Gemmata obscuriglobus TaxID=114 RepID=A0A2Z3HAC8_9BACT|nr:serine/threonine-protein kinase [Gemmata obscuriglobus]AWM41851.1 serine/threonine protein kinase [Gemmata obscuriglobus]QEG32181.1 Serine/threonine-protein kinase PknH [Gemmata obscuriglobus]VTS11534.1 serine threonine protein kinase : Serine/threonine protein kinase OS=Rhodopirellula baltica SWK14 GN=RBSWK_04738 PE=3 SV=1: Pkinase [Gemmata obscuriglobus UQM 2246]
MPTPTARTLVDRIAYFDAVCAAGVLAPNQLTRAAMAPGRTAAEFAAGLVAAGLLTRFQADRLLAGRADGFVFGPYVILEPVGRGSMSRVYKARHRTMNRAVAIKILSAELTRTAADRQRFQAQARAAGRLSHPNVVTALDANVLADRFYLVLEFVDGPNLEVLVAQRGPRPVDEACELVRQIAHGLRHAHERGAAHGHLAPDNVLISRPTALGPPTVKITGFGLPPMGTGPSAYRAPESLTAPHAADPGSDLYALGGVFYFLLTGHAPSTGAANASSRQPAPVAALRPDVPPAVAAVVHRLMAPHPSARFASAAELLAHLDAACVPAALPVDGVSFDLPPEAAYAPGSGYLTGRQPLAPDSGELSSDVFVLPEVVPEQSPWAQLTEPTAADATASDVSDTRILSPYRVPRLRPPFTVPVWVAVGAVLFSLVALVAAGKFLVK